MTPINFITHLAKEHNIKFCPGRVVTNSAAYKHCLAREMSFASACAWHKCLWAYSYQINISKYSSYVNFFLQCLIPWCKTDKTYLSKRWLHNIVCYHIPAKLFWFFNNFVGYTLIGVHATKGKVTNLIQFSEDTVFVLSKRWLHNGQKVKPKSESGCCLYIWCINSNCASLFLSIKFCC